MMENQKRMLRLGVAGLVFLAFVKLSVCFTVLRREKSIRRYFELQNLGASRADVYTLHWEKLLTEEYQEAVVELKIRRSSWSRKRLEDAGMSIFDAFAEPESDLFGEKIVRIVKGGESLRLGDKFSRGDILVMTPLARTAAAKQPMPKECCVMDVGKNWMTLAVGPSWPAGLWEARRIARSYQVRLDRTAPRAAMQAQRQALELVRKGQAGHVAAMLVETFCDPARTNVTSTRPARLQDWDPIELEEAVSWELKEAKELSAFEPNSSQQNAISWALGRSISLLQGPPGTGKTHVAALLIKAALGLHCNDSDAAPRVLAVTHSNGAADVLLQALLDIGVAAVRVGRPASVSASVRHRTVIAIAEKHPEIVSLRKQGQNKTLESHVRSSFVADSRRYMNDVCDIILKTAPVVVASCIGAHQLLEADGPDCTFPLVVVDEAAQTTEPALLCALAAAKAEQIVLVGDTKQLPPTIASESVELRNSLGVSPMSRLEAGGVGYQTLRLQYRMSPALLEHPSQYFYNGLVTCADLVPTNEVPPKGFPWPNAAMPLAFIHSGGDKEVTHAFGGKSNPTEAALVVTVVKGMLDAGNVAARSIAVISPYSKQVQQIQTNLAEHNIRDVRVGTVDSFQGQETDIVVFSAVRSNLQADIGFLRDSRRLCVAITRARRGLVLVGDQTVLCTCRHWAALMDSCRKRGCTMDANDLNVQEDRESAAVKTKDESDELDKILQEASFDWENVLFDD